MNVGRLIADNKRLLFFVAVGYTVVLHFVYTGYWNRTKVKEMMDAGQFNHTVVSSGTSSLPSLQMKSSSSTSRGNVSGESTSDSDSPVRHHHDVDVHVEDPVLGHAGEVQTSSKDRAESVHSDAKTGDRRHPRATIAIGGGITGRGIVNVSDSNVTSQMLFFSVFLPSFCRTASADFAYRIYLAYDHTDPAFDSDRFHDAFRRAFEDQTRRKCSSVDVSLHLIQCSHTGSPTWAQNDAMLEAYLDHVDYFYRINDDTEMLTGGWTEVFLATLNGYDPPRVGVVGPNHSGGNVLILTYDFVHRTHVDVFGFYYPRLFTDWWGDDWITMVYSPGRNKKLGDVRLAHTMVLGRRYVVNWSVSQLLQTQINLDKKTLERYIEAVRSNQASGVKPGGRKVISMSLYGKDARYTWGVIRNAQLVPVYLPEWRLRVYVAADPAPAQLAVPPRIINKLRLLGAEVAHVSVSAATGNNMAPIDWRLLAADDQNLDYFLVRDADTRLSDRETSVVRDWLSTSEKNGPRSGVIHCVRDHPKHVDRAIVDGLWGGRPRPLRRLLRQNITRLLRQDGLSSNASTWSISSVNRTRSGGVDAVTLLDRLLWPSVGNWSYCHDSVSPCDRWKPSTSRRQFPRPRRGLEYVGQKFDAYQKLLSTDGDQLTKDVECNAALYITSHSQSTVATKTDNSTPVVVPSNSIIRTLNVSEHLISASGNS